MAERLLVIRLRPECIADWGAFLGASREVLGRAYPRAQRLAVEADAAHRGGATESARPWWSPARWSSGAAAAVAEADLAAGQAQLLWANMGLHFAIDPQAVMRQWHRALAIDGFVMFSTLGPGSLGGLRTVYARQQWPAPFAPFVDMHDLGDMLVEAGFAGPVMDQEVITLTWASPAALLAELRTLGGNVAVARHAGLRTPRWRQQLLDALVATVDADGRVAMDFEVVYGHAFRPPPRLAARTEVALDDMRAMARARRRPA